MRRIPKVYRDDGPARRIGPPSWLLDTLLRRPDLAESDVLQIVREGFGLAGRLEHLYGERDQNFRLSAPEQASYVVKIVDLEDCRDHVLLQNEALKAVACADASLAVPRLVTSAAGDELHTVRRGGRDYGVRVLTYVSGQLRSSLGSSPGLRRNIGCFCARLGRALATAPAPARPPLVIWDLQHAGETLSLAEYLTDPGQRALVERVHEAFFLKTDAALDGLPGQTIHNDFNRNNVLVAPGASDEVGGVIDFGDAVYGPAIIDLAVAMAHECRDEADPISAAGEVLAGYSTVSPVADSDVALLGDLICTRLALGAVIRAWRTAAAPDICSYDPKRYEGLWRTLDRFIGSGAQVIGDALHKVARKARQEMQ